jgi:Protein of unknown function (DUF3375)
MSLDYGTLEALRRQHPAWRLLAAEHAPLVASFLQRVFIAPNVRVMAQTELVEALNDTFYGIHEQTQEKAAPKFPKPALEYLNDWAANEKGWLRKFYPPGSDEPHFDVTPATERALAWLSNLSERAFVGTESRLLMLFELLKQMSQGSDTNPETRIAELQRRRDEIDAEIALVASGNMPLLDETAVKDRFQQFDRLAKELLGDFRQVEQNFRVLDRTVRERIAMWDGSDLANGQGRGTLLQSIMGERDAITDSDQGKSFRAFWGFLMSQSRQDELTVLLERVLALPPVAALSPDKRLRRVHYDWLQAGEHAQRTVALLSQQLRRFLDDQAWLENRRIMDLLHGIEAKALHLRGAVPTGPVHHINALCPSLDLAMERPLYSAPVKTLLSNLKLEVGDAELDADVLFSQVRIDKAALASHIRQSLQTRSQVSLVELLQARPLQQGLGELVAYLQLASVAAQSVVDEGTLETVSWTSADGVLRSAKMPRVIFVRT